MRCLRCGYCCIHYDVIIVHPAYALNISIDEIANRYGDEAFMHKKTGDNCPHLRFEDGLAVCCVRNLEFYEETPCFQFSQIEDNPDRECRIGRRVKDGIVKL